MKYEQIIRRTFEVDSQHGDEFLCRCPYHDDAGRPNLYANGVKGVFLCHACGAKGRVGGKDVPEDWEGLIRRLQDGQLEPPEPVEYSNDWLRQFNHKTDYWEKRGFSPDTIRRFQLGYDPLREQGVIPVRNEHNTLIGAIRRNLDPDERPKYLYPKGFPLSKTLFASWMLGKTQNKVALVEGSLDAIACWNARVPTLGLLGARLSLSQHRLLHWLSVDHIVIMTDNDTAGRSAVDEIIESASGLMISVGVYRSYWNAKDPGDLDPHQIRKMFHSARRTNMQVR